MFAYPRPNGRVRTKQTEFAVRCKVGPDPRLPFRRGDKWFAQRVSSRKKDQKEFIMHAYVINLARSKDRRAHITAELQRARLDYEVITAVDGRTLDLSGSTLIDPSLASRCEFPAGTVGCALSHFHVYQKILEDGRDRALVLEDDVTLPADLNDLVDEVAGHLTGAE